MTARGAVAVGGGILGVALTLVAGTLLFLTRDADLPGVIGPNTSAVDVLFAALFASWSLMGALLTLRVPANRVGHVMLAIGVVGPLIELPQSYGNLVHLSDPDAPILGLTSWLSAWTWIPPIVLVGLVVALVPDGRLPSPRWRPMLWLAGPAALLQVSAALAPGPLPPFGIANPFGVHAPWLASVAFIGSIATVVFMLASASALLYRFRRSRGVERQQLKWIAYGGVIVALAIPVSSLAYGSDPLLTQLTGTVAALGVAFFPFVIAIAVLRYRLYDIDLVVRRTVGYAALSAIVAVTYLALVVLLQSALRPLTGGSEVAVAGSTLATLALVQPLRRRIQAAVDRRFDRARYDAALLLDAFSDQIGREVDLDEVGQHLLGAIHETIRPQHASVWLREAGR